MSIAKHIAPHLPYLRRYARALTGTQNSGDGYVAAALEVLIEEPGSVDLSGDVRTALFRSFSKLWKSIDLNLKSVDRADPVDHKITSLTAGPRQAFLLSALEGFSLEQISKILDEIEPEVSNLLNQAGREIAEQVNTSVLIIEDEPLISLDIEQMVQDLGHRVTAIARTHGEAIYAAKVEKPGLILADIKLADGSSGIDAVHDLLQTVNVPVIFITAYPERLLTGQRPEPAFLVTKPFHPDMVKAIISQALFFEQNAGELLDARVR